jgi:hypothetical protein
MTVADKPINDSCQHHSKQNPGNGERDKISYSYRKNRLEKPKD